MFLEGSEELDIKVVYNRVQNPRPCSFEITKPDGTVVFSKLETGRLPTLEDLEMILKKLKE
jgi:hypothetical protein